MPKLAISQSVPVTIAALQEQMNKVVHLLKGNLSEENVYSSGSLSAGVQTKKVVNSVDETKPVEGFKFFSYFRGDSQNFFQHILNPLLKVKSDNIQPRVLEGRCSFVFNNSTMEKADPIDISEEDDEPTIFDKTLNYMDTISEGIESLGSLGSLGSIGKLLSNKPARKYPDTWEKRIIEIPKTPFIRIMSKQDIEKLTPWEVSTHWDDDFYLSFTFYADYEVAQFQNNIKAELVRDDPDMITIAVYFSTIGFDKEDYFTFQLGVEILCKEVL